MLRRLTGIGLGSSLGSSLGARNMAGLPQHFDTPDNNQDTEFDFTPENYKKIEELLAKYPSNYKQSGVIPMLWIAQRQNNNWIPLSAMNKIAELVNVAPIRVYETCTFYTMFNRQPVGKHFIQLCGTTPCMVRGAKDILKTCQDELGITSGMSKDGKFSLLEVECLGACVNAPMVQINDDYYEDLTPESMKKIIQNLREDKPVKIGPQINRNLSEGPEGRTTLLKLSKPKFRDIDQLLKDESETQKED